MHTFKRLLLVALSIAAIGIFPVAAFGDQSQFCQQQQSPGQYGGGDQYSNGQYSNGGTTQSCFPGKGPETGFGGAANGSNVLPIVLGGGAVLTLAVAAGGLTLHRRRG